MTEIDAFLGSIERFMRRHKIKPGDFGEMSVNDRGLVFDLRAGRSPTLKTVSKVRGYMKAEAERRKVERQAGRAA